MLCLDILYAVCAVEWILLYGGLDSQLLSALCAGDGYPSPFGTRAQEGDAVHIAFAVAAISTAPPPPLAL